MSQKTPAVLVLADGSVFRGVGRSGPTARDGRRGGLQHRHDGLPGDPHRSLVRRPDRHAHLPAHRQHRHQPRGLSSRAASSPPGSSSATCRSRPRTGASGEDLPDLPRAQRHRRHRRHRHAPPHAHPAHARARRTAASWPAPIDDDAAALAGGEGRALDGRPGPRQGRELHRPYDWNGSLWALGTGYKPRASALPRRGLRLRREAQHPAQPRRARLQGDGAAGAGHARRTRSRSSPTACSSPTAPAIRSPATTRSRRSARSSTRACPTFGICLGHQLLGLATRREDREDEVRPPRRQPPGAGPRHRARLHHQPEPRLRGGREDAAAPTCAPRTGRSSTAPCRASSSPTSPPTASRATPRRARAARDVVPVRQVRRDDGEGKAVNHG